MVELRRAAPCADDARAHVIGNQAGDAHREHHRHPGPGFDGREHAAAEFVGDVAQELPHVQHRTDADRGSRQADEE